jgi:phosphate uptake regulator
LSLFLGVRKVQKVGYSTYVVSLPKKWVEEMRVGQGDILSFRREPDGTLTVTPGLTKVRPSYSYRINADLCNEPGFLGRAIVANYMAGHDTLRIESKGALSERQNAEVQQVCNRLTGVSIVEYGLGSVTLQSFVDPSKTSVQGLLRRLQIILSGMIAATAEAIAKRESGRVDAIVRMEEEADRIYSMIVRQLLFALTDRGMAKEMGINNPHYILGYRVIAKSLEEMADITTDAAREIKGLDQTRNIDPELLNEIVEYAGESRLLTEQAFEALMRGNPLRSNNCMEKTRILKTTGTALTIKIRRKVADPAIASCLEHIAWNLVQLGKYVEEVAEVALNQHILSPSQLCTWEQAEEIRNE